MKKIQRTFAALLAAVVLTAGLAACGGSSGTVAGDSAGAAAPEFSTSTDAGAGLTGELAPMDDRKIIYTAHLDIECANLTESLAALETALAEAQDTLEFEMDY